MFLFNHIFDNWFNCTWSLIIADDPKFEHVPHPTTSSAGLPPKTEGLPTFQPTKPSQPVPTTKSEELLQDDDDLDLDIENMNLDDIDVVSTFFVLRKGKTWIMVTSF